MRTSRRITHRAMWPRNGKRMSISYPEPQLHSHSLFAKAESQGGKEKRQRLLRRRLHRAFEGQRHERADEVIARRRVIVETHLAVESARSQEIRGGMKREREDGAIVSLEGRDALAFLPRGVDTHFGSGPAHGDVR